MNKTKKRVLIVALAVCLIATLSMGTLAWFTAEDEVTNKFMVGDSTTAPDKVFGIDVWEEVDTNDDAVLETVGKGDTTENTATYQQILPGKVLPKKPYLTNTGIHPQYVRAIVTVTEADILKAGMAHDWSQVEMFLPGTSDKWELANKYYTNDTFVFVYYYNEVLAAGATTEKLFDAVVIPTELTKEQAAEMVEFDVNVFGQAIQSEHLADVTTAKEAFAKYITAPVVDTTKTVEVPVAPLAEDFLFPAGTNAVMYENMKLTGDAQIVHEENAVLGLCNVTAELNHDVIIRESDAAICISDCEFTLTDGAKLIVLGNGGSGNQIFLINVKVNGVLLTQENYTQYLGDNLGWVGVYPEWPQGA